MWVGSNCIYIIWVFFFETIYNLGLKQNIIVTLHEYLLAIMMIEKLF